MKKIIIGELDIDIEDSGTSLIGWVVDPLDNDETGVSVRIHSSDLNGKHKEFHELFDRYKTVKVTIEGIM